MPIWRRLYYPSEGERNSPVTSLKTLLDFNEQANFIDRFKNMSELEMTEWPHDWRKHIDGFYQLTAGNFRAYYAIRGRDIVILHVCRKVGRRARPQDLEITSRNLISYEKYIGEK